MGEEKPFGYVGNPLDYMDFLGLALCGKGSGGKGLSGNQLVDRAARELDIAAQRAVHLLDRGSDFGTTWGKIYQRWGKSSVIPQWLKNTAKGNAVQQITDKLTHNNCYLNELGIIRNRTGIWGSLRPDYHAYLSNGKVAVFDITTTGQATKIGKYNIDNVTEHLINILY